MQCKSENTDQSLLQDYKDSCKKKIFDILSNSITVKMFVRYLRPINLKTADSDVVQYSSRVPVLTVKTFELLQSIYPKIKIKIVE